MLNDVAAKPSSQNEQLTFTNNFLFIKEVRQRFREIQLHLYFAILINKNFRDCKNEQTKILHKKS